VYEIGIGIAVTACGSVTGVAAEAQAINSMTLWCYMVLGEGVATVAGQVVPSLTSRRYAGAAGTTEQFASTPSNSSNQETPIS
jgi:hypothetical protein